VHCAGTMTRLLMLILVAGTPAPAPGTTPAGDSSAPAAPRACFRGRPLPRCRSFWITEAEGGLRLAGPAAASGDLDARLGIELGWMRNLSPRTAIGGGLAAGWDGVEFLSLRPRYRRWLTPVLALDVSPGVRWTPGRIETVEARVAVSWNDLAGVWTEVDAGFGTGGAVRWLAGVKTGAQAGLVSYVLGAITFAILIATFPRD
jgi:hypothetical protein